MNKAVGDPVKVRAGVWHISYDHECECGCKSTRYTTILHQNAKPGKNKIQNTIDEHYNQQGK